MGSQNRPVDRFEIALRESGLISTWISKTEIHDKSVIRFLPEREPGGI